ncbi:MAG TPA: PAS domain S-box protein, partial [Deltaproteobacteria bacterium]|nr:PAS domain S-box protein [Deltaproteobacteria bacterium]
QAFIARGISDMTSSSRSTVLMLRMISRDGRDMLVQWQYKPVHKTDGGIDFIFGMGIDITGQKRAEELGRISEKKFQAAFHASADPMAIFDPPTGRIIDVNTAFVTWSGYTADEAIGRTTMDLDIWQDPSDRDRYIGRLRLGETVDREEVRLRNRTGAQYIVILSAAMVEVEGRSYLFLTLHDITDLRNAQTRLAKSERHYRLLAENASDVIWVLNPDLTYRFVSPSVENLRGYTVKEVLGQTLRDVLTPESYRNAMELMQRERLQEVSGHRHGPQWSTTAEFEMTRRDGTTVWTEARLSVLYDDEGKVSGILGITRDITQRKQAETALRERQRQMETLMGNLPGMAYRCRNDENWTMEFVSQGCLDITGYSPEDLVGSARVSYAGLIHPEDRDPVWSQVQEALSRREHFRLTYRIIHRDTGVRWVWEQGTGVPDTDGRVAFLEGFITDITERKLAEEALRKSEERYRLLAENVRDVIWVLDMDLRYTYISPSVERMRGFTVEEAMGMPLDKVMTPEFYQLALTVIGEELERERHGLIHDPYWSRTIEGQILHKDGSFLWVEITATFLRDDDGNITGILGVTRDISKRRHAEDVLQQIRFAVEHLGEEAFWISREGRFIYVNEASCRALGCTREELLSMGVQDIDPLFQPDRWPEHWQELKERGSLVFESIHRRKNGSEYPVEIQANFLEFGGQEFNWAFARDITERKHADAKLRESEERFRRMAEVSPEVFWMTSPDWSRVIYLSPAFEKIFGFPAEELVQNPSACLGLIHEQDRDAVISFFRRSQGPDAVYEFRIVRPDGSVRWIRNRRSSVLDEQGRTILLVGIAEDITERVQAEEERKVFEARLARSQKLEAIGTLAGGIAHDFNNILSAIIGYSELAQEELPASSPAHASLAEVIRAGDRAKDLVRQILTFSRQMETERKPVRVQLIVKEVMKLLRSSIPRTITIRDSVDPSAGPVFADPTQIHQVIMNLCTNAYHAMLPAGGELTISVDSVFLDAHFASQHPELREGAYLRLAVQDTGTGMDPETMKRIFDPFFTTKEKTKGTGLGLATVHGIVTDLGGSVMVTSTVGKGSTFEVYLPVSKKQEDEDEEPEEELGKGRGQTILLVDDEEAILHFTGTMLEQLGYLVIRTSSSLEALGMFRSNPQGIDLVITDQTMPGLTGMALASEIIRTRPGIPVILMTGYSETVSPEEALAQGIEEYIEKPFTRSTLARSVQRCLSEKNRP